MDIFFGLVVFSVAELEILAVEDRLIVVLQALPFDHVRAADSSDNAQDLRGSHSLRLLVPVLRVQADSDVVDVNRLEMVHFWALDDLYLSLVGVLNHDWKVVWSLRIRNRFS